MERQDQFLDRKLNEVLRMDWEKWLYVGLIVLALISRLVMLGAHVQSHDESLHCKYSWDLYTGRGFQHTPLMHGPFLFHMTALFFFLFGDSDFTARLGVALLGVVLVAFPYFLRRWLGRWGALATSLFLLVSPGITYYSRYIRNDVITLVWSCLMILPIFAYLRERRTYEAGPTAGRWLYLFAAAISLMFATKEVSFIYGAIFGFFLVGLFAWEAFRTPWQREDMRSFFLIALAGMALGLMVAGAGIVAEPPAPAAVDGAEAVQAAGLPVWGLAGLFLAGACLVAAAVFMLTGLGSDVRRFPAFDLIIVLGTLCLPFLSPLLVEALSMIGQRLGDSALGLQWAGLDPINYSPPHAYYSAGAAILCLLISAAIGLWWDWRRWLIAAVIHYAIFLVLFTTVFTNGAGLATGMIGSLGYWLVQQGVQRGQQPWYYYGIVVPLYEFLPLLGSLAFAVYVVLRRRIVLGGLALGLLVFVLLGLFLPPIPLGVAEGAVEEVAAAQPARTLPVGWVVGLVLGTGLAVLWYAVLVPILRREISPDPALLQPLPPGQPLFLGFVSYWAIASWVTYSYAGEKMPWLEVHIAWPMILLTGWLVGQLIEAVPWSRLWRERAWLLWLLLPALIAATAALGSTLAAGPLQGMRLTELQTTGKFIGALLGTILFSGALSYVVWRTGWRLGGQALLLGLLGLLLAVTVRTSYRLSFINYDRVTEHLFYAQAAPDVKDVMGQIEELSRRTTGSPNLVRVAYGSDGSWPFIWYLRNFPNAVFYGSSPQSREQIDVPVIIAGREEWDDVDPYLGDDYLVYRHTYLWWPMQDYYGLDRERILYALTNPQMRAAVWQIFWNRDYTLYDQVTDKNHQLNEWPLRNDFRLYVRRDVALDVWDLGASELTVSADDSQIESDYTANWVDLNATHVWGALGSLPGQFSDPRGVALASDGSLYVADAGNHRIQHMDSEGVVLQTWGAFSNNLEGESPPLASFWEPWGVAVGPDGSVYVADTWNHRIQKFAPGGEFVTAWGVPGQDVAAMEPINFFGPRALAVDVDGNVYVTDTGNKRVVVFDADGRFVRQWGGGGVIAGRMDEPVGIAVSAAGEVFVADTWNHRVQVFSTDGVYLREWPIYGWDSGIPEDKPYLALDEAGHVFVTDPGRYQVLVFDLQGNYLASFGLYGTELDAFKLPVGIAAGRDGAVYVADGAGGRIMRFDTAELGLP